MKIATKIRKIKNLKNFKDNYTLQRVRFHGRFHQQSLNLQRGKNFLNCKIGEGGGAKNENFNKNQKMKFKKNSTNSKIITLSRESGFTGGSINNPETVNGEKTSLIAK
jgi:hypothetical protein